MASTIEAPSKVYKNVRSYFSVWTCWNETTQSLNFGHYDLTKETAIDILYCKGE